MKKKINLYEKEPEFGNDSYITVVAVGHKELMFLEKEERMATRKISRLERMLERLLKKYDAASDQEIEALYDQEDKIRAEIDELNEKRGENILNQIKKRFVEGKIKEDGILRDLRAEDIDNFDTDLLAYIGRIMYGMIEKKESKPSVST